MEEKDITSLSDLKESIVTLRDKNYKTTRAIKDTDLREHLGESKTLNISKWKLEVTALKKEKDNLYSQIVDIRKEVEQAENVRSCIEKLLQENRGLTQVKKQELAL